ncbi:MAG: ATP-binding protein [Rhodospirillales bacterium]
MFSELSLLQAFSAGAVVVSVLALAIVASLKSRHGENEAERCRLEAVAIKAREMIAAAPDGLFLWDSASGSFTCSRRLAQLLDLEAGVRSSYDDICIRFDGASLKYLEHGVSLLRGTGTGFDLILEYRHQRIQAIGARAQTDVGETLADMVWMRDITAIGKKAELEAGSGNTSGNSSGLQDRHLTALLDALPMPVWLRDSNLSLAFVNLSARDIALTDTALAAQARKQGKSLSEQKHLTGNGADTMLEITETPLGIIGGGNDGATGGTIGIAITRSGGEETKDNSRRPASDPNAVLDTLDTAIAIFDADQNLIYYNDAYVELWRLDADWLKTKPGFGDVLEKLRDGRRLPEVADFRDDKITRLEMFEALIEPFEELLSLPDGRTIQSRVSRYDKSGLVFVFDDVSSRLDLERSYKSLDAVQHETLDNLNEGIAVFGADGRLKLSNPVFQGLWDFEKSVLDEDFHVSDFVEHTRSKVTLEGGRDDLSWGEHKKRVVARLMTRENRTGKLELNNGTVVYFANVPLPDGAMLLSYLDVTASTRVEQALRQRAEGLAEADRLKSKFIANVSHEIRTPLNTILGFADMLGQEYFGKLNRRQGEYAHGILDSTRDLMSIVSDILDLASIEAGNLELDRDTVDVHGLLVSALNLSQERARSKELKLEFDCAPDIGWIFADGKRLKQVVFNLMSNAITFTPARGTVRLESHRHDDDLIITVADTGIGIPQGDRERVFQPFEQGGQENIDNKDGDGGGTGLGLSLVRNFIQLHGGTVEIKSPQGRGTTVTCRLPSQRADNDDGPKAE